MIQINLLFRDVAEKNQLEKGAQAEKVGKHWYKSWREVESTIPRCVTEFCQQIQLTQYGMYDRGEVIVGADIGVIFDSDKIAQVRT